VFDVVLMTGLPESGSKVELDGEEVSTEIGDMIRRRMAEWEREEMARRVPDNSGKKRHFFQHYLHVMIELCDEHAEKDQLGIWLKLYAFIVQSGVLFAHTPYGAHGLLCIMQMMLQAWICTHGQRPYCRWLLTPWMT